MNPYVCRESHKDGIILVNSVEHGKRLVKAARFIPLCSCKELIHLKGVAVGWKNGNMKPLKRSIELYLRRYWSNEGLLNDETEEQFSMEYEKISSILYNGEQYRVGDHVVTRKDGEEFNPVDTLDRHGTWKAKITLLFIHEFRGYHQSFFHARWFKQVSIRIVK
jgi:hypothetical protein